MRQHFPFRYFEMTTCFPSNISRLHLQIIPMAVIYHMRYPLRFRQVEDILHERGIDIFHETVRCLDGHLWSSISEQRWTTSKGEAQGDHRFCGRFCALTSPSLKRWRRHRTRLRNDPSHTKIVPTWPSRHHTCCKTKNGCAVFLMHPIKYGGNIWI